MNSYKIIYPNPDSPGTVIRVHPMQQFLDSLPAEWTEQERLIYLADRDLPTGTKYEIVHVDALPDGAFREAWEYEAGPAERESADPRHIDLPTKQFEKEIPAEEENDAD